MFAGRARVFFACPVVLIAADFADVTGRARVGEEGAAMERGWRWRGALTASATAS